MQQKYAYLKSQGWKRSNGRWGERWSSKQGQGNEQLTRASAYVTALEQERDRAHETLREIEQHGDCWSQDAVRDRHPELFGGDDV